MKPKIQIIDLQTARGGQPNEINTNELLAVRFITNDGLWIDVSFSTQQDDIHPGSHITIRGERPIVVTPRAGNVVMIKIED
jgi:hypothetical protein